MEPEEATELPGPDAQEVPLRYFPAIREPEDLVNLDNEADQSVIHQDRTRARATEANAEILRGARRGWKAQVAIILADLRNMIRKVQVVAGSTTSVSVTVSNPTAPTDVSALSKEATQLDVKRGITDYEARFDYETRTDTNPVYIGRAAQGTATNAGGWTIQKFTYDGASRVTRIEVLTGTWDGRAALAW